MLILWKARQRDPDAGCTHLVRRPARGRARRLLVMRVRIVVNAGGLNPRGLGAQVRVWATAASTWASAWSRVTTCSPVA